MSDVVRIDNPISYHLSKLSNAKLEYLENTKNMSHGKTNKTIIDAPFNDDGTCNAFVCLECVQS